MPLCTFEVETKENRDAFVFISLNLSQSKDKGLREKSSFF